MTRDTSIIGITPITRVSAGEYRGRCTVPDVLFRVAIGPQ